MKCTFQQFVQFLDKINNGSQQEKAELSFNYLSRQGNGFISYDDIEVIISEISFVWNFLTGQKISTAQSIELICKKLGVTQTKSLSLGQYLYHYDHHFQWYDFFNTENGTIVQQDQKQYYTTMREQPHQFKIDQIQEYVKLMHNQIQSLLYQFKDEESLDSVDGKKLFGQSNIKGPTYLSAQELQPKGDAQGKYGYRETLPYLNEQQLSRELQNEGQNIYQIIANRLQQLSYISTRLFGQQGKLNVQSARQRQHNRNTFIDDERKKTLLNITQPSRKRRNIIYFGHQNWNIMLNMMLGIRRSLKSHYYKFSQFIAFSEEDLHCKYYNQLLYKRNDKSVKEISQIFVDYSPKVFYFIRKFFNIDNTQFLKSIGLQNLIGNLLLGNLSTLSDQTSQGKNGSFIYYTDDSKIIVKSITRQQYKKLRQIIQNYVLYIKDNPETYLMRIYGLYKMKNKSSGRQLYFMVIGNVFDRQIQINERYDIKGATYNRQTLEKQQQLFGHILANKNVALKDMDLINNHHRTFEIELSLKEKIYRQILKDAQFLKKLNIIEYSLLIGVHQTTADDFSQKRDVNLFGKEKNRSSQIFSLNKKQTYFFGIIDILSEYTAKKVLQNKLLGMFNDISCRDPEEYYQRFKNFIYKYVFSS